MKRAMILLVASVIPAVAIATTLTASWIAPTTNTDGSPISATVTYNLYTGAKGAEVKSQSGLTSTSVVISALAGTQVCARVTAVANNVESAQSPEVCATAPFPTPSAPVSVVLTAP